MTNLGASAVCRQVMVGAGAFERSRWIEGLF